MKVGTVMKKIKYALLLAPLLIGSLTGCGDSNKIRLSYGNLITDENSKTGAREIDYSDIQRMMDPTSRSANENFLLVVAPTNGCYCWEKFQIVLKQFINETNYLVYQIKISEFDNDVDKFGIAMKQGNVALNIISNAKVIKTYVDSTIFENVTSLKSELNKHIKEPLLYYVDQNQLNDLIKEKRENMLVYYARNGCGDCAYATPNAVLPYLYSHNFTTKFYIIDIQDLYDDARNNGSSEYQEFKDIFNLSNKFSPEYGYGNGVVPTFQYYEKGQIIDASVYFNDSLIKKDDGTFEISETYYTQLRTRNLKYLKNVKTNVLEGLIIPEEDVDVFEFGGNNYYSWNQNKASVYHKPLFEAFMDTYAK